MDSLADRSGEFRWLAGMAVLLEAVGDGDELRLAPPRAEQQVADWQAVGKPRRYGHRRVTGHRGWLRGAAHHMFTQDQVDHGRGSWPRRQQGIQVVRLERRVDAFGSR